MAGKRNGLGKGLDSLIPNKTVKEESASQQKVSKEKQEKSTNDGKNINGRTKSESAAETV